MSFPISPTNGQQAIVNGIVYNYNSSKGAWVKSTTTAPTLTTGNIIITSNVASTSTGSGAIVVNGGIGVNGSIFLNNTGDISANIGAFQAYANTKIGTNTNGNLFVSAATTSTSTTTGALVVAGGLGVAGNIFSGNITAGNVSTAGHLTAAKITNSGQFFYNARTITANTTIAATENAMSVGPITIADGVEVVINDGGEWSIV